MYYPVLIVVLLTLLACAIGTFVRLPFFGNRRRYALVAFPIVLIGGGALVGAVEPASVKAEREQEEAAKREEAAKPQELRLASHKLASGCDGLCLTVSGVLVNETSHDRKDAIIKCVYYAESGTVIGSHRETLYKIVPAGGSLKFRGLDAGIRPDQAKQSSCDIVASFKVD